MNTLFKGDNKNLLVLGGIALAAAYFLMNRSTTAQDSGTSGGNAGSLWGGSTPQALPDIIYQFPPEGQVNFPQNLGGGLDDLLKLLTGPAPDTTGTKKEAYLDAGDSYGTGILKTPFRAPGTLQGAGPNYYTAMPNSFSDTVTEDGTFNNQKYSITGYTPPAVVGGTTKKESYIGNPDYIYPSGFSNQYIIDPLTDLLQWNNYAGFGMSKDPATGESVAFQRDIYIVDSFGNEIYNPVTKKGNALTVISQDQIGRSTFGISEPWDSLSTYEQAQVISQVQPNYVTNSYDFSVGYANLAASANVRMAKKTVSQIEANVAAQEADRAIHALYPDSTRSGVYDPPTLLPYPSAGADRTPYSVAVGATKKEVITSGADRTPFEIAVSSGKKEMTIAASIVSTPSTSNVTKAGTHTAAYMAAYNG